MRTLALLLACSLSGCGTLFGPTVTVKVPVPVPCNPPAVDRPAMPTEALLGLEDVFVVGRALWAELEVRDGYEERLRAAVDGCRN